jgi:SAM-dependent methyltransferase
MKRIIERGRMKLRNALNAGKALFSAERYPGSCPLCGCETIFTKTSKNLRETFSCACCHSYSRNRFVAKVLLDLFHIPPPYSLNKLVRMRPDLAVYETASYGPIHIVLKDLKGYICSDFFYDVPFGACNKKGIRCENIEALTFPDGVFDLVISQDVFEHVRLHEKGFQEISRILKNGGFHIFTVPLNPFQKTFKRIEVRNNEEIHLAPRVYHGDPVRGGLVYTDFGIDLPEILSSFGFSSEIHWCSGMDGLYHAIYWVCVIVSQKI